MIVHEDMRCVHAMESAKLSRQKMTIMTGTSQSNLFASISQAIEMKIVPGQSFQAIDALTIDDHS